MKTIIAGSRTIDSRFAYNCIEYCVRRIDWKITEIFSGLARGVDTIALLYSMKNGIKYKTFKAKWDEFGKKAGPMRNLLMSKEADALIAIWDGESRGTKNMIEIAKRKGIKIYVLNLKNLDKETLKSLDGE